MIRIKTFQISHLNDYYKYFKFKLMTAPAITFTPTSPIENKFFDNFSVYLYSQADVFTTYYNWATPVTGGASNFQRNAAQLYSGYVLRFSCTISSATPSGLV
jgi:hypothetical protein